MLARRLRRRPNINPALDQCLVFAGVVGVEYYIVVQSQKTVTAYFASKLADTAFSLCRSVLGYAIIMLTCG